MKADWILRIEVKRFFESKAELRARVETGKFKDQIHRAVFAATMEAEFTAADIKQALGKGMIGPKKIRHEAGSVRNIYVWLEEECTYQPVAYKRWAQKVKEWAASKLFVS